MMLVIFALLGLAIGSFLNVVIYRLPQNESIVFPSSNCPNCHKKLKIYHNIPLVSWLFLGGKCAFCKEKISWQYPLVEFMVMCLFVICYLISNTLLDAFLYSLVFSLLLALSLIDLRYKAVPDALSLPALIIALFAGNILTNVQEALMYAGGFALLKIIVSFLIKKEAMGEADIIIAAIIGAIVGTPLGLVAIYLSAIFALFGFMMVRKSGFELPFIPFLSLGLFLTFVFDTFWLEILGNIYG